MACRQFVLLALGLLCCSSLVICDSSKDAVDTEARKLQGCSIPADKRFPLYSACASHCECAVGSCHQNLCREPPLDPIPVPVPGPQTLIVQRPNCGANYPDNHMGCLHNCECACGSCWNSMCFVPPSPIPIAPLPTPIPLPTPQPYDPLPYVCKYLQTDGATCRYNCDCACGNCLGGFCRPPPPPSPPPPPPPLVFPTPAPKPPNNPCGSNWPVGFACSIHCECLTGYCGYGKCLPPPVPTCGSNFPLRQSCSHHCECACGNCWQGTCGFDPTASGQGPTVAVPVPVFIYVQRPKCGSNWGNGNSCSHDCECGCGSCWQGSCGMPAVPLPTPPTCGSNWPLNQQCTADCQCACGTCWQGVCQSLPTGLLPTGAKCQADIECASGKCGYINGPYGFCLATGGGPTPLPLLPVGSQCTADGQCQSGICNFINGPYGFCGSLSTPMYTPAPRCGANWPSQYSCSHDCECGTGFCNLGSCGVPVRPLPAPTCGNNWPIGYQGCTSDCQCSCGTCWQGTCQTLPSNLLPTGAQCTASSQCASGKCGFINGPSGYCLASSGTLLPAGSQCTLDTQCASGICNFINGPWGYCGALPAPLPGPTPICSANRPLLYACTSDCECNAGACYLGKCFAPGMIQVPAPVLTGPIFPNPLPRPNPCTGSGCGNPCSGPSCGGGCSGGGCKEDPLLPIPVPVPGPAQVILPNCGANFPDMNACISHCECSCGSCLSGFCQLPTPLPTPLPVIPTPAPYDPKPYVCRYKKVDGATCKYNCDCACGNCVAGFCVPPSPPPPRPPPPPVVFPTPAPKPPNNPCGSNWPVGYACSIHCECITNYCGFGKCLPPPVSTCGANYPLGHQGCNHGCECGCGSCWQGRCGFDPTAVGQGPTVAVPVPVWIIVPQPRCGSNWGNGNTCSHDCECGSGSCWQGSCGIPAVPLPTPPTCGSNWPLNQQCTADCQCACGTCWQGVCQSLPTGLLPTGAQCTKDIQCASGHCGFINGPFGFCLAASGGPTPLPLLPVGSQCTADGQCQSGICNYINGPYGFCGASNNILPLPQPRCGANWPSQYSCNHDCECGTGFCNLGSCGVPIRPLPAPTCGNNWNIGYKGCTSDCQCASGICLAGVCTALPNTLLPTGSPCSHNSHCATSTCGNLWGSNGFCLSSGGFLLPAGTRCTADIQCASGMCNYIDANYGYCSALATPLPAPISRCGANWPVNYSCTSHCECNSNLCNAGTCGAVPFGK